MTKLLNLIITVVVFTSSLVGQDLPKTKIFSFTPELNTKINGIGLGLMINSPNFEGDSTTTIVNGLNLEIIGVGFFGPLAPSNPLIPHNYTIDEIEPILDSIIIDAKERKPYMLNGISLSAGGLAGHEVQINGLNISGISTITARTNGISIAILMNMNVVMHGISIGLFNKCLEHKGLQIGLFNRSEKTKGIQIGLWNKNEKRSLPFINWNF